MPADVPFAEDFGNLYAWHLERIRRERPASLALYRNLCRRGFTLTVRNFDLSVTPDTWILDDEDRAAITEFKGYLVESVLNRVPPVEMEPDDLEEDSAA